MDRALDGYKNKIYFTDDIIKHLVKKGFEKRFVINYLSFVVNEVRECVEDENIANIKLGGWGSFYITVFGAKSNLDKVYRFNLSTKKDLDFAKKKYEATKAMNRQYKKSYKGGKSKFTRRGFYFNDIINT